MSTKAPTSARYRNNAVRHLTAIARDLQSRLSAGLVDEQGFAGLRPSLGAFLSLISIEARPITVLAEQLHVSKQACSQLANLAEKAGYIERKPDNEDRRSKVVSLSPHGRELVRRSVAIIRKADEDYAAVVGAAAYARFTAALAALYEGLNVPTRAEPALLGTASRTVGALPLIAAKAQQDLMSATAARGHAGLKMSHSQVLPVVGSAGSEGVRMSDLARIQKVGRKAISTTSRDLEELGYIRREPDPLDGRGVVLHLTEQGVGLVRDSVLALGDLERTIERILGVRALGHFLQVAKQLYVALDVGEDIFDTASTSLRKTGAARKKRNDRSQREMEALASELHRELGSQTTRRLAELLEDRAAEPASGH